MLEYIPMCDEMKKLRDILDKKGIKWEDASDTDLYIYRTKFEFKDHKVSVIYGWGTYGGKNFGSLRDELLLEMMIDNDEPDGRLTANEIVKHLGINRLKNIANDDDKLKRIIEILGMVKKDWIKESDSEDSNYDFYVDWSEAPELAEELDSLCCELFIAENGGVNWENINKFTSLDNSFDVTMGDGDSFGWLTGVICDADHVIMYYCYG